MILGEGPAIEVEYTEDDSSGEDFDSFLDNSVGFSDEESPHFVHVVLPEEFSPESVGAESAKHINFIINKIK